MAGGIVELVAVLVHRGCCLRHRCGCALHCHHGGARWLATRWQHIRRMTVLLLHLRILLLLYFLDESVMRIFQRIHYNTFYRLVALIIATRWIAGEIVLNEDHNTELAVKSVSLYHSTTDSSGRLPWEACWSRKVNLGWADGGSSARGNSYLLWSGRGVAGREGENEMPTICRWQAAAWIPAGCCLGWPSSTGWERTLTSAETLLYSGEMWARYINLTLISSVLTNGPTQFHDAGLGLRRRLRTSRRLHARCRVGCAGTGEWFWPMEGALWLRGRWVGRWTGGVTRLKRRAVARWCHGTCDKTDGCYTKLIYTNKQFNHWPALSYLMAETKLLVASGEILSPCWHRLSYWQPRCRTAFGETEITSNTVTLRLMADGSKPGSPQVSLHHRPPQI